MLGTEGSLQFVAQGVTASVVLVQVVKRPVCILATDGGRVLVHPLPETSPQLVRERQVFLVVGDRLVPQANS